MGIEVEFYLLFCGGGRTWVSVLGGIFDPRWRVGSRLLLLFSERRDGMESRPTMSRHFWCMVELIYQVYLVREHLIELILV